jgi:carboxypeptidase PM20D1
MYRQTLNDDRITVTKGTTETEASSLSSSTSTGFISLHKTIKQLFPEVLVSPNLVVGATDSRHFREVSNNIYRFSPIRLNNETKKSFHGLNERLAVSDFKDAVGFYVQLIKIQGLTAPTKYD